jgi:hypothetical protein
MFHRGVREERHEGSAYKNSTSLRAHVQQALCRREDRARVDVGKCRGVNVVEKAKVVVG